MPSNVSVQVTANETQLVARLAIANSNVKSFGAAMRSTADQVNGASAEMKASLLPVLEQQAAGFAAAKAQAASYKAAMADMAGSSGGLIASMKEANASFESFIGIGKLFVAGAIASEIKRTAEAFVGLGTGLAQWAHTLEVAQEETGLTVQQLAGLRVAAEENGIEFDRVTKLVVKFGASLQDALQNPAGKAARALEALGISADFVKQHSDDAGLMLTTVAQKLDVYASGLNKAAIEGGIFGQRMGPELTPVLHDLATGGFDPLVQKAKDLGVALDEDAVAKATEAEKSFKDFGLAITGLEFALGGLLLPTLTTVADKFTTFIGKVEELPAAVERAWGPIGRLAVGLAKLMPGAAFPEAGIPLGGMTSGSPGGSGATGSWEGGAGGSGKPQAPGMGGISGDQLAQFREKLANMEADWKGTHLAMLNEAVEMWHQEVSAAGLSAKEKIAAEKGYADARRALNLAAQTEGDAIAKNDSDTDLAISRLKIASEKAALDVQVQNNEISAQQKLQILQNLTNQEFQLNKTALENQIATLANQPVEFERVFNEIRLLKAKNVEDLAALNRQASEDARKQASDQTKCWRDMVGEITSAERGLVSNIFSGRQSLNQSLLQMGSQLLQSEIANDLKYLTVKIANSVFQLGIDQKTAAGGLLAHMVSETQKTGATVVGTSTRTALEAQSNTTFLGRLAEMVLGWFGLEVGKTAETAAGETTRTALTATGLSAMVAAGFAQIQIDAAVAAAGASAATAAIPFVGPGLAPAAAQAMYLQTIGWADSLGGGIAGFADGTDFVPRTGLALIHMGEKIIPASQNNGPATPGGGVTYAPVVNIGGSNASTSQITRAVTLGIRNAHTDLMRAIRR